MIRGFNHLLGGDNWGLSAPLKTRRRVVLHLNQTRAHPRKRQLRDSRAEDDLVGHTRAGRAGNTKNVHARATTVDGQEGVGRRALVGNDSKDSPLEITTDEDGPKPHGHHEREQAAGHPDGAGANRQGDLQGEAGEEPSGAKEEVGHYERNRH